MLAPHGPKNNPARRGTGAGFVYVAHEGSYFFLAPLAWSFWACFGSPICRVL